MPSEIYGLSNAHISSPLSRTDFINFSLLKSSITFLFLTLPTNGIYLEFSRFKVSTNLDLISLKVTNSPTLTVNSLGDYSKVYGKYLIYSL